VKFKPALIFDFFFVACFAYMIWEAREWDTPAKLFPWAIGFPMAVLAVFHLVTDWQGEKKQTVGGSPPADVEFAKGIDPAIARSRALAILGWIIGFLVSIWLIGFSLSTALVVFVYLKMQAREGWGLSLLLACGGWLIYYALFEYLLKLPFPDPKIFSWLGMS
jgi:hypothetical protein